MRYKIVKENKPTLTSYGKYKAKTVHNGEVDSHEIIKEVAKRIGTSEGNILGVMTSLGTVINEHLRRGDTRDLRSHGLHGYLFLGRSQERHVLHLPEQPCVPHAQQPELRSHQCPQPHPVAHLPRPARLITTL